MSIAFDASYYLLQYPDVAAAVVGGQFPDAYTHFVLHGAKELRNPNAQFNAAEYAGMYPDVANAVAAGHITSVWDHYVYFGIAENRAPSLALKDFDAASYLAIHTDVAAAVTAGAFKSAIDHYLTHGQAENRTWGENTQLTNGTDKLVANKFVAGLVYTPGGNDRINSLQDEDELTGIGTNPTLTATLGNAHDNGGTTITPVLKGIQTVNVAFSGSGTGLVTTLDLQDATGLTGAVNVTRISLDVGPVGITNMASIPAELSVSNNNAPTSGVLFQFLDTAAAGTADVTRLTVSNVDMNNLVVRSKNGSEGIETINLVTTGPSANRVGNLMAQDLVTLTISGGQNLTLGTIADGNVGQFRTIDGSAATGNLTLTLDAGLNTDMKATSGSGVAVDFQLKTGSGDDSLRVTVGTTVGDSGDVINLGAGKDTLAFESSGVVALTDKTSASFAGVEAVTITRNDTAVSILSVDFSRINSDTGTDQTIRLTNGSTAGIATFRLNNLTAGEAGQITLTHSSTGQNELDHNLVVANLADASGAADHVSLTIVDGINSDPRFNFQLAAGGTAAHQRVENVTLIDNDTESNTVELSMWEYHTGTITLKGGVAGQFLNLDARENIMDKDDPFLPGAGLGVDGVGLTHYTTSNPGSMVAALIAAESYVGDVIIRLASTPASISATGAQTVRMGAGNDFVIFDNLNDSRAGLTIADTVSGGAGADTLAIGGNIAISLTASEWTNVTGFETIRLIGNGASYHLALTDQLILQNAGDGKRINIVNDNDPANDVAGGAGTAGVTAVSAVTIDARNLSAGLGFTYNGEEGAVSTADRFIFADHSLAGQAIIDGGAVDNLSTTNSLRNDDVLEVRNAAVVSTGDLLNIKNVGTIELTNDRASAQSFTLQLNDAVVDAMVDSYHASSATEVERLGVRAYGNSLITAATTGTRLEAGDLTSKSALDVLLGRGINNVTTGAGADRVVVLGNYASGTYLADLEMGQSINSLANGGGGARIVTDVINLGEGNDTLATYGVLNLAGSTLTGIETIEGHSAIVLTAAQLDALTSLNFVGAITHELFVVFEAGGPTTVDLSRITVATGGTLYYNLGAGLTGTGAGTGTLVLNPGLTADNIGTDQTIYLTTGGSFTGTAGANDTFVGTIASLVGTTITGTATDHDALRLADAGTVMLGNAPAGGTITNIHTLVLANGSNDISFANTTGITSIIGNDGADTINVVGLSSVSGGNIALGDGNDKLYLGNATYTGTINGGVGTDILYVNNGTNIAGATVSGFETLNLPMGASMTLTPGQHNSFTTITAPGTTTLNFSGAASPLTLHPDVEHYDFTAVTQNISVTTSTTATSNVTVTGGSGGDFFTVKDAVRGKTTLDLNVGGPDTITIENTTFNSGGVAAVTIRNFTSGDLANEFDSISWGGAMSEWTAINTPQPVLDISGKFLAINSGIGDFADGYASIIATAIQDSSNYLSGAPTFYAVIYGSGNAHLVEAQLAARDYSGDNVLQADVSVELVATLTGIDPDSLMATNFI